MDNTHARWMTTFAFVLAALASVLGVFTAGASTLDIDLRLSGWIQQWQGKLPRTLEHLGDMSGETLTAIGVVVGSLAVATLAKSWRVAVFLMAVGILRLSGMMLKPIFASPRPGEDQVTIRDLSHGFGYPSGHSMTAAMIATIAIVIAWNTPGAPRYRWLVTALAAALMLLVGWSRVWSGAHWPTDVLGGWSYGVALVLLAWVIAMLIAGSRTGSRWRR